MTRRPLYRSAASILSTILAMFFLADPFAARAEEGGHSLRVVHRPPESKLLPPAGTLMPIVIQVADSTDITTKIRLVGSRDGRFMDIAFPRGQFDAASRLTYTIEVPAPSVAMTYQFITHQPNGDLTLSDKFLVKRSCVPPLAPEATGEQSEEYRGQVVRLIAQARDLEKDNLNLETAIKLLDSLKKDLSE